MDLEAGNLTPHRESATLTAGSSALCVLVCLQVNGPSFFNCSAPRQSACSSADLHPHLISTHIDSATTASSPTSLHHEKIPGGCSAQDKRCSRCYLGRTSRRETTPQFQRPDLIPPDFRFRLCLCAGAHLPEQTTTYRFLQPVWGRCRALKGLWRRTCRANSKTERTISSIWKGKDLPCAVHRISDFRSVYSSCCIVLYGSPLLLFYPRGRRTFPAPLTDAA